MLARGWGNYLAIGGLAVLAVLAEPRIGHAQHPNFPVLTQPEQPVESVPIPDDDGNSEDEAAGDNDGETEGAQGNQTAQPPSVQVPVQESPGNLEAGDDDAECDAACQREKDDLDAQRQMARAAWAMFIVAALGLLITAAGVFLIYRTLIHTKAAAVAARDMVKQGEEATKATLIAAKAAVEANKIQREAFIADQRAWLVIESSVVTSDLVWDREEKRGAFSVRTTIMNRGKTPAVDARVETKSDAQWKPREEVYREVALAAASTYRSVETGQPVVLGNTLFPGGGTVFDSEVTITEDDFAAIRATLKVDLDFWNKPCFVYVTVYFCVGYNLIYADKRHQTGCILRLDVLPDAQGSVAIGPYFGDTPKSRLRLVPDQINGMRAD